MSDVTDRLLAEEERERLLAAERAARAEAVSALNALAESTARHRELFENARDSIFVIDLDRRIADVNAAAERMSGYTRDELVGLEVLRLVSAETSSRAQEQLERTLSGSAREAPYEIELVRKDGQIVPVEINSWLVEERGQPIAIEGIVRDVSERHELEEQLRHAQKMDALGRLAGGISHDFNNLLTAIAGYSEFLLAGLDEGSSLRHDAEEIRKAAARAADLTRQLLAFSRRQVLEPRVLSLNGVIFDTEKMLGRLIGEHIELVVRLDATLGHIRADPGQIEQVIVNLAVNARDAMPQGGRLTKRRARPLETAQLGLRAGPYVVLTVADTGVGMDGDVRSHLFEPFFTTKKEGTGLGLATVYGIVRQSGGCIAVESEPRRGSRFDVYLPRVDEPLQSAASAPPAPAKAVGHGTVLLVEDEEVVRPLVRKILERHGYRVVAAVDGADALRLCRRHDGPIDLLLTDVVMPTMSGPALAQQFQALRPQAGVLYISGYTDEAIGDPTLVVPGSIFLQKPFSETELVRRVREALEAPS